ncbi:hypothetical protein NIES19_28460 [Anabaena cylindrica PCC 7122]|nr:hypothetical protein NIES19_28460 [Anabaena cylindrica PCC 7122]
MGSNNSVFSTDEQSALEKFFHLFDEFTQADASCEQKDRQQEILVNTALCK